MNQAPASTSKLKANLTIVAAMLAAYVLANGSTFGNLALAECLRGHAPSADGPAFDRAIYMFTAVCGVITDIAVVAALIYSIRSELRCRGART